MKLLFPGVGRLRMGTPEAFTPVSMRLSATNSHGLSTLPAPPPCPLDVASIRGQATTRGYVLEIPLAEQEEIYGFGLQFHSFRQREAGKAGLKKTIRVNSDPIADTGDSHAPVPFYVSTRGYGVLVDTARYATFYCDCAQKPEAEYSVPNASLAKARSASDLMNFLGDRRENPDSGAMRVEVPHASGADIYVFWGEDLKQAIQRYNLFSGGGCLPPRWGLGIWYRARSDFDQTQVLALAKHLREREIPCDVFGLEPGWQTQAYPCSFEWSEKFPDPLAMTKALAGQGFRVNLWTHLFTHPSASIYSALRDYSGDYTAMNGLVPDLASPQARKIIADQHERDHVEIGVSGYKLDECDNSDFNGRAWSFPEISQFPSGLNGEQMHSLLGILYQETIDQIFRKRNQRTYNSVRASHALAASYPFVLYSDLYNHRDFVRALTNSGFSGLLWTPEVRHADDAEDLVRRLQTTICSPQALVNAWYIKNPPWEQWNSELNNEDERDSSWEQIEAICRDLFRLRMRLVPYLYAAFARYSEEGLPPFRALVQDFPDDMRARAIDDQYMMGEVLLVAPLFSGQNSRRVYLPAGQWHDFWSGEKYDGEQEIEYSASLETFPLFVRDGALLPLAEPTLNNDEDGALNLTISVYGDGRFGSTLFEDDGISFDYETESFNRLQLKWHTGEKRGEAVRVGKGSAVQYRINDWQIKG